MPLLIGAQIHEHQRLTREGWRKRQLQWPDLYSCIETRSYGAGPGYVTAFQQSSLDWAEPIVQARASGNRSAGRLATVVSSGSVLGRAA